MIWCLGNATAVPIIKCIGLGLGLCLWGSSNMLIGWASGRFGILGAAPESVADSQLNYIGVALAATSMVIFFFVKSEGGNTAGASKRGDAAYRRVADEEPGLSAPFGSGVHHRGPLMLAASVNMEDGGGPAEEEETSIVDSLSPGAKKTVGVVGSIVAGLLYGTNFNPAYYARDHLAAPCNDPRMSDVTTYVFPHFCGIFVTSTALLLAYSLGHRNHPKLYPEITLPGFLSGCIWAVAQIGFFYANENLGMVVSFPLITVGPGLVGALWGVFVFREVVGLRNYLLLAGAFAFAIAASVCIALSNK